MRTALYATFFLVLISVLELGLIAAWAGPAIGLPMPVAQEQLLNGLPEERNESSQEKETSTEYLHPPAWLSHVTGVPAERYILSSTGDHRANLRFQPVWIPPPRHLHPG